MNRVLRQQQILNLVQQRASVSVNSLVRSLDMSPATVRRDLADLEQARKIIRTHGAVLDPAQVGGEPSLDSKRCRAPEAKRWIGQEISEQIPDGSTVFLDAGSTCLQAGIALLARENCDLYTNSIPLLGLPARARLTVIGGTVRGVTGALVGPGALEWLEHLRFDVAVLGVSALDSALGCFTTELTEAGVKRAAARRADRIIVAADHEKFTAKAPIRFLEWSDVHTLVTDRAPPPLSAPFVEILTSQTPHHETIRN